MVAEGQGRDGGAGDLFEDLDQFFASMEGSEWPDPDSPSHLAAAGEDRPQAPGGPMSGNPRGGNRSPAHDRAEPAEAGPTGAGTEAGPTGPETESGPGGP